MRSRRASRRELKAEIAALKEAVSAPADSQSAGFPPEPAQEAPKIVSCGYPLRSEPQTPKSLKEAKDILMSLREW